MVMRTMAPSRTSCQADNANNTFGNYACDFGNCSTNVRVAVLNTRARPSARATQARSAVSAVPAQQHRPNMFSLGRRGHPSVRALGRLSDLAPERAAPPAGRAGAAMRR